jgi:pyridoxamine 5'-phosphate oxidase
MTRYLAEIRKGYQQSSFKPAELAIVPIVIFKKWFQDAQQANTKERYWMLLAPAGTIRMTSARFILIRVIGELVFIFYSDYTSKIKKELAINLSAILFRFRHLLGGLVRLIGGLKEINRQDSDYYFRSQPNESKIVRCTSTQSKAKTNRLMLEHIFQNIRNNFKKRGLIPILKNSGGYLVIRYVVKFWQGRQYRIQDLLQYILNGDRWKLNQATS